MATTTNQQPAESDENAAIDGDVLVLGEEAIQNLTDWFDVLIRMDQEQQRKKGSNENE
jgi:hypothetical protein